jgi:hypothetical protein
MDKHQRLTPKVNPIKHNDEQETVRCFHGADKYIRTKNSAYEKNKLRADHEMAGGFRSASQIFVSGLH